MRVRYVLVKKAGDKTFQDYIKTTEQVFKEKGVILEPVKKLPRKLKKTLKKFNAWEYEIVDYEVPNLMFGKGVVSDINSGVMNE